MLRSLDGTQRGTDRSGGSASQREHRDVPLLDAAWGYIHDVLEGLPDEEMDSRPLAEAKELPVPA